MATYSVKNSTGKVTKEVRYLNRDFSQFRQSLIDFSKIYFPNTYNDFNESDPGMMFMEMASYVGDVLSYYLDSQIKELILSTAAERENIIQLAQTLGYQPKASVASIVNLDMFQLMPATGTGINTKPDYSYALSVKEGMQASSETTNQSFITLLPVDFKVSSSLNPTNVTVYSVDGNGAPIYYLLKKSVLAQSGEIKTTTFQFGAPEKYSKVLLPDKNVISIEAIVDSDNNTWHEVDYLAQDTIFKKVKNVASNDPNLYLYNKTIPYLLKLLKVPRRFIKRLRSDNQYEIRFGAGISNNPDEEFTPNPDNVGLPLVTGTSKLTQAWDPSNFLYTRAYGQVPQNTTLTVKYTVGGGIKSNVQAGTIVLPQNVVFDMDETGLDLGILGTIKNSLATNNAASATGGADAETDEAIRNTALAYFGAQDRTVTKEDYVIRCYSMPAEYGTIAKAYVIQDEQLNFFDQTRRHINPMAMNLYILSQDADGNLVAANNALKENLKLYLDENRILTDSINIKDAFIINYKLKFEISVLKGYIAKEVLLRCIDSLKEFSDNNNFQIGQPIVRADFVKVLANTAGVQSVIDIEFTNLWKSVDGYSGNIYSLDAATFNDVIYPSLDPSIFEIKNPDVNIQGIVSNY
jgi:hypothetical protein